MIRLFLLSALVAGCSFQIPPLPPTANADMAGAAKKSTLVSRRRGATPIAVDGKLSEWTFPAQITASYFGLQDELADGTWPAPGMASFKNDDTLSATVASLWDTDALYFAFAVTDDILKPRPAAADPSQGDAVELFIDGDASASAAYDADDRQLFFNWGATALDPVTQSCGGAPCAAAWAVDGAKSDLNGWNLEVRIPWSAIGGTAVEGRTIGFDFTLDDDDGGSGLDRDLVWFADPATGGQPPKLHPDAFGLLELGPSL